MKMGGGELRLDGGGSHRTSAVVAGRCGRNGVKRSLAGELAEDLKRRTSAEEELSFALRT